jgi:hypothetical protein
MFRKADDTTINDAASKRQRLMQSGLDDAQSLDAAALPDDLLADTSYVAYSLKPHGSSHEALLAEADEFVEEALDDLTAFTSLAIHLHGQDVYVALTVASPLSEDAIRTFNKAPDKDT